MRPMRSMAIFVFAIFAVSVSSCSNSPTVPLPPPDMTVITATTPDEEGFVTVSGGEEAAEPESIVLLFNETSESGVMEAADPDGSFEARLEAARGDSLVLQYKVDAEISYAAYIDVK